MGYRGDKLALKNRSPPEQQKELQHPGQGPLICPSECGYCSSTLELACKHCPCLEPAVWFLNRVGAVQADTWTCPHIPMFPEQAHLGQKAGAQSRAAGCPPQTRYRTHGSLVETCHQSLVPIVFKSWKFPTSLLLFSIARGTIHAACQGRDAARMRRSKSRPLKRSVTAEQAAKEGLCIHCS